MRRLVAALFLSTIFSAPALAEESLYVDRDGQTEMIVDIAVEDFSATPEPEEQLFIVPVYELPAGSQHAIIIQQAPQWDFFGTVWRKITLEVPPAHKKIEEKSILLRANFVPHRLRKLDVRFNRT